MADTLEQLTIRKVAWRLLPFLFLMFIWCLIDRVNLAFAALTMNADLGFTATMYSLGASIFFLGYCTFEVPSNLLLERYGARIWLSRIMITWGIVSSSMAFITGILWLLHTACPVGARRGGILSRRGGVPDLLVSARVSRSRNRGVSALGAAHRRIRRAAGHLVDADRRLGSERLAMAVPAGGHPLGADRHRRAVVSHRPAGQSTLAAHRKSATGSNKPSPPSAMSSNRCTEHSPPGGR